MNRRSFLRSVGAVVAVVLTKAGIVDPAPAEEELEEEQAPCDSCIGLVCSMCSNYEWYLYADPKRSHPGLDAVHRAGHMYPWEGTAELPRQFRDAHAKFNEERRKIAEWAERNKDGWAYVGTGPHTVEGWVEYFNSVQKGDKE